MNPPTSRRTFVTTAAAATLGVRNLAAATRPDVARRAPPSERIRLALIGANGMGRANLANCSNQPDVVVAAICDVSKQRREEVAAQFPGTARAHADFREVLDRPDIDAVIIATPPHWHAAIAVAAAQAGKDVYLQKPMTLYPDETLAVRNAFRRHQVISQVGTQIHASENYRRVVEWIRSGRLGPVNVVRTFNVMNQGPDGIGRSSTSTPPPGVDWEMWLGPAPARPFNELLFRDAYNHCSFWDYSGGWTPGMAPHIVDLPIWALDLGVPLVTHSTGGRFVVKDDGDAPDTQEVVWQYPATTMTWSMNTVNSFGFDFGRGNRDRRLGIYFHALRGTLFTGYDHHEIIAEGDLLKDLSPPPKSLPPSPGHEREWLDCVKSRRAPSCCVDYHWRVDLALTLANLSYKLGRSIRFDPKTEKIVGDSEARRRARPEYRRPWRFPSEYL